MVSNEGAGRVRLSNGARMSLRSYRESMAEQYPEPTFAADEPEQMELDELTSEVGSLKDDVKRLKRAIEPREALARAQVDKASGKLYSDAPTRTKEPSSVEADLWN